MRNKPLLVPVILLVLIAVIGCQPGTVVEVTRMVTVEPDIIETTKVVTREVEVNGVTEVVTEVVSVLVTATPEPLPQGGSIIVPAISDIDTLNPLLTASASSQGVAAKIFLGLFSNDPFTGALSSEIAQSWDVSPDGLTYTFNLRRDLFWSDGMPLTARDVVFTWDAINTPELESPNRGFLSAVAGWEMLDDYTVSVSLTAVDCVGVANLATLVLPAHIFDNDPFNMIDHPFNMAPTVASGPFQFDTWQRGEFLRLAANDSFYLGRPNADFWNMRIIDDSSARVAAFLAGELDYMGLPPQFLSTIEAGMARGEPYSKAQYVSDGYSFLGLNYANPDNPQDGWIDLNDDGMFDPSEPIQTQDPHPILGEPAVRQAIAYAVDYDAIIKAVAFGQGISMNANTLPGIEWAYNHDLTPYAQDLVRAEQLLTEAGWIDSDGDGIRERDGATLAFSILTNSGTQVREDTALLLEEALEGVGFDIELEILDFGTVVDRLINQNFDATIIGFVGVGSDPDDSGIFSVGNDVVGSGLNFVSFYNETFEANLTAGKTVPGCAEAERAPYYLENQAIFLEEVPYAVLYVPVGTVVINDRLKGVEPTVWSLEWNIQDWYFDEQ